MVNLQPMLNEDKQSRANPQMKRPELKKLFEKYGEDAAHAIATHWHNVEMGLTDEYKQLEEV